MTTAEKMPAISTLCLSAEELDRARRRIEQGRWKQPAEALLASAQEAFEDQSAMPEMDVSWFDADPTRDFGETYIPFHRFLRPATEVLGRGRVLAWSGLIFNRPEYLQKARQLLMHFAAGIATHVRHHDSGMEYGRFAVQLTELYACLAHQLTEAERDIVLAKLDAAAEAIQAGTEHWLTALKRMPYSNHLAFQRHGLLAIGLLRGRDDWVSEAIDGTRGFGEMLNGATFDDGLCFESSTHYHYATFRALLGMAELVRHRPQTGRDLYRETFANGRCLKQMFDAPLGMLLPGGELPPVGDCYANRNPLWKTHAATYELGYAVYGDPRYAWLLQRSDRQNLDALLFGAEHLAEACPPGGKTRLWVEHGYSLLTAAESPEDYWQPSSAAPVAFLSTDRNGIHHHLDRMGLQIAAAGRLWLEDVESTAVASEGHGFVNPIQAGFNRTTLAHNLVVVDHHSQQASLQALQLVEFKDLPGCKTVTVADPDGILYDGVRQMRSIVVTGDYVLDVCQVDGGTTSHLADLVLHPRADGDASIYMAQPAGTAEAAKSACPACASGDKNLPPMTDGALLPDEPPYNWLREVKSADLAACAAAVAAGSDCPLTIGWQQGDGCCLASLSVLEGEVQSLSSARWPLQSNWQTGGRQMFFLRATGSKVTFLTLYQVVAPAAQGAQAAGQWRISQASRYHNGLHDELRLTVGHGSEVRSHILQSL